MNNDLMNELMREFASNYNVSWKDSQGNNWESDFTFSYVQSCLCSVLCAKKHSAQPTPSTQKTEIALRFF